MINKKEKSKYVASVQTHPWLRTLFAFIVIVGIPGIIGCGKDYQDEIVVISPHPPEVRNEFSRGFSEWYLQKQGKKIAVKWIDVGGTGECIEYILSRKKSGEDIGVDIFFGGGKYPFLKLKREGMLAPRHIESRIRSKIPATIHGDRVYSKELLWFGAALSGFGIIYNKAILEKNNLQIPNKWQDIASQECFGWVASGDPRYSGSIQAMYEILLQAYGWEKGWEIIARIGGNVQQFEKGGSSAAKNVSRGQSAYGLSIDFYAFGEIARYGEDRIGFILPEGETVINPIFVIFFAP